MIKEIADRIFSSDHAVADGKNAIIFGRRSALAIDCGTHQAEGDAMAAFIRDKGFGATRLVLTHCHTDHILGGKAFEHAEVIAHKNAPAVIQRHLGTFARVWKTTPDEVSRTILRPTILFSGELTIDLGDRTVRLLYTPGHSEDHISVYVDDQQLLIAGDAVVNGIIPAFSDGDSRILQSTIEGLLRYPIKGLLPGHGFFIDGEKNVQSTLHWITGYLTNVRAGVRAAQATGASRDAAIAAADFDRLVGDRLPVDKMLQRHRNSVGKIFDEEAAALAAGTKDASR
jgi:glyoxylase-like metal-dependent hydrolase (beta-lactamase superfamily II)